MSNHLSQEQFARCVLGREGTAERQHARDCPECSAELQRFTGAVSVFRSAVQDRVESQRSGTGIVIRRPRLEWRWALATAVLVILFIGPFFMRTPDLAPVIGSVSSETDPDALMRAVSLQLSRTLPAPMEPVIALFPQDLSTPESGGVR